MNTLQNLLDNGIDIHTAIRMLSDYQKRIGTDNGIYIITDITYDFENRGKDVTLKCRGCGNEVHRLMISGRNKWSELIKSCPCEKERKAQKKVSEIKKSEKTKKGAENHKINKGCSSSIKFDESYIGRKNNYLTVIGITRLPNKHRAFLCECDCGGVTTTEPVHWERGIVKSCGCLQKSLQLEHSEELDRLRRIHNGMMQRCYNQNAEAYRNYGGRGICICQEWHDREKFIEWALKNGYDNSLSIDRINVNGNYEPNNCRWADVKTQFENRRPKSEWKKPDLTNRKTYLHEGEKKFLKEIYEIYNTSQSSVLYRMKHMGMTFEEALVAPKRTNGRPRKVVQ